MKTVINYMKPDSGGQSSNPHSSVIFGMDVAIINFMRAFFRYSRQEQFFFLPGSDESIESLKDIARAENIDFGRCAWLPVDRPRQNLGDVDVFFRPDPNLPEHIWRRLQLEGKGYALSTIVHTMSGERVADVLGQYLTAPTRAGDAIICPSRAIRDAVKALWEIQSDYYRHRFKGAFRCPVDLPVIPLGIHTERFQRITSPYHRAAQRQALGIADDETVILYVGRMSYATKAHPLPLFRAAESAARQVAPKKVRLLMYGFYKPENMEQDFHKLAADICKTVRVDFIKNNDPRFPDGLWAAGDLFTSLIDNIQESFGFTPIEAMASALPAIISDWDGYRDGVRHGVDGFLIPTRSVAAGNGLEVARHYYNQRNYGDYLIRNNQAVAVDAEMAAAAMRVLIEDRDRRRTMGEAGRTRAQSLYDWKTIIASYENLWEEQAARRSTDSMAPAHWAAVHPAYPDPSAMFASFPSAVLKDSDKLEMIGETADIEMLARHTMNIFGMDMLLNEDGLSNIMSAVFARPGATLTDIRAACKVSDAPRFARSVAWFLKMGLMRVRD